MKRVHDVCTVKGQLQHFCFSLYVHSVSGGPEVLVQQYPKLRLLVVRSDTGECLATARMPAHSQRKQSPLPVDTHPAVFVCGLQHIHSNYFDQKRVYLQLQGKQRRGPGLMHSICYLFEEYHTLASFSVDLSLLVPACQPIGQRITRQVPLVTYPRHPLPCTEVIKLEVEVTSFPVRPRVNLSSPAWRWRWEPIVGTSPATSMPTTLQSWLSREQQAQQQSVLEQQSALAKQEQQVEAGGTSVRVRMQQLIKSGRSSSDAAREVLAQHPAPSGQELDHVADSAGGLEVMDTEVEVQQGAEPLEAREERLRLAEAAAVAIELKSQDPVALPGAFVLQTDDFHLSSNPQQQRQQVGPPPNAAGAEGSAKHTRAAGGGVWGPLSASLFLGLIRGRSQGREGAGLAADNQRPQGSITLRQAEPVAEGLEDGSEPGLGAVKQAVACTSRASTPSHHISGIGRLRGLLRELGKRKGRPKDSAQGVWPYGEHLCALEPCVPSSSGGASSKPSCTGHAQGDAAESRSGFQDIAPPIAQHNLCEPQPQQLAPRSPRSLHKAGVPGLADHRLPTSPQALASLPAPPGPQPRKHTAPATLSHASSYSSACTSLTPIHLPASSIHGHHPLSAPSSNGHYVAAPLLCPSSIIEPPYVTSFLGNTAGSAYVPGAPLASFDSNGNLVTVPLQPLPRPPLEAEDSTQPGVLDMLEVDGKLEADNTSSTSSKRSSTARQLGCFGSLRDHVRLSRAPKGREEEEQKGRGLEEWQEEQQRQGQCVLRHQLGQDQQSLHSCSPDRQEGRPGQSGNYRDMSLLQQQQQEKNTSHQGFGTQHKQQKQQQVARGSPFSKVSQTEDGELSPRLQVAPVLLYPDQPHEVAFWPAANPAGQMKKYKRRDNAESKGVCQTCAATAHQATHCRPSLTGLFTFFRLATVLLALLVVTTVRCVDEAWGLVFGLLKHVLLSAIHISAWPLYLIAYLLGQAMKGAKQDKQHPHKQDTKEASGQHSRLISLESADGRSRRPSVCLSARYDGSLNYFVQ